MTDEQILTKILSNSADIPTSLVIDTIPYQAYALANSKIEELTINGAVSSTKAGYYLCENCKSLKKLTINNLKAIDDYAFSNCTALDDIKWTCAGSVGQYAFSGISIVNIDESNFPYLAQISNYAFANCSKLEKAYFNYLCNFMSYIFLNCPKLKVIEISDNSRNNPWGGNSSDLSIVNLWGTSGTTTNIEKIIIRRTDKVGNCSISSLSNQWSRIPKVIVYVPDSLVDAYKSATNWSLIADKIKPLSELPEEEETT